MGKIYWRKEENALLLANPQMAHKELAVLIAELGFRTCTAEDVKSRRKRIKGPQPPKPPTWTKTAVETLKKHWEAGLTPAQIHKLMPVHSRSAIRAKGDRMGWPHPDWSEVIKAGTKIGGRVTAARLHKPVTARSFQHGTGCVASASKPPQEIRTVGPTPASLNLRMWDQQFTSRCCKWATGEDEQGFLFCAAPRGHGLPYCRAHAAAAYRPSPPRPPSAVKDTAPSQKTAADDEPKPLDFEKAA